MAKSSSPRSRRRHRPRDGIDEPVQSATGSWNAVRVRATRTLELLDEEYIHTLSIAFLDAEGRILNIDDMAPQTETTHWSKELASMRSRCARMVRRAWVKAGDRVEALAGAKVSRRFVWAVLCGLGTGTGRLYDAGNASASGR